MTEVEEVTLTDNLRKSAQTKDILRSISTIRLCIFLKCTVALTVIRGGTIYYIFDFFIRPSRL